MHRPGVLDRRVKWRERERDKCGSRRSRGFPSEKYLREHQLSLSSLFPNVQDMPTFPTSGVVAFQQVMESWTLSGLVEEDLGLLCCLRGNLAHLGNPSLSFGTPEAVLFLASFLVCHYSLVTERNWCFQGFSELLFTTPHQEHLKVQCWIRGTNPMPERTVSCYTVLLQ